MSKVTPHLVLPTEDTPQSLDGDGYLLDEDGQLVWEDGSSIDGQDELPTTDKVGPHLEIPNS